ncbi:MAG: SAP domain-containing protein [Euryarchaeota archaeon]|jgi:hypothetical protein|nr:SAP domain-containing protein [Euryarchaeota archaeon]
MNTNNRFLAPGITFAIAIVLFMVSQTPFDGYEDGDTVKDGDLVFFLLLQCLSVITCFVGVILLAYALGRPGEKINVSMVMQDISNPAITKVPFIENYGDSKAQGYGSMMLLLSFGAVIISIFLAIAAILSMGGGIFSGGTCDESCETTWDLAGYSCVGGIIIFIAGLITVARPWAWFGDQQKVVVVQQKAVAIPQNESNQDDLSSFTVVELKEKLKQKGLAVSGKKEDLIARLKTGEVAQKTDEKKIHNCSNCQQVLKVPVDYEGRIKCPTCDTISTL